MILLSENHHPTRKGKDRKADKKENGKKEEQVNIMAETFCLSIDTFF